MVFATLLMIALHGIIFAARGGEIQKIVLTKTNTVDPRSATFVDLIYAFILLYFKELNDVPMSTTRVFWACWLAARLRLPMWRRCDPGEAMFDVATDIGRAGIGLAVSVTMAIALPFVATGSCPTSASRFSAARSPRRTPKRSVQPRPT